MQDSTLALVSTLALALGAGAFAFWWARRAAHRTLANSVPLTRRERELGVWRFTPAHTYSRYRNPMRTLRRALGWPSGRQWVKTRKRYNRMMPGGTRRLAALVQHMANSLNNTVTP